MDQRWISTCITRSLCYPIEQSYIASSGHNISREHRGLRGSIFFFFNKSLLAFILRYMTRGCIPGWIPLRGSRRRGKDYYVCRSLYGSGARNGLEAG